LPDDQPLVRYVLIASYVNASLLILSVSVTRHL